METHRFSALEGARAILAFWVMLGHLLQQSGFNGDNLSGPLWLLRKAHAPVLVFMMLSGFVISHLIVSRSEPYPQYIARRWLRLFPLLAACIIFVLLYHFFVGRSAFPFDRAYLGTYLAGYATMLHGVIPNEIASRAGVAMLPPAWSISLEWQFYLVAPALVWLFQRKQWIVIGALGVVGLLLDRNIHIGPITAEFSQDSFLPVALEYFIIGIASYFALPLLRHIRIAWPLAPLIAIAVFFVSGQSYAIAAWSLVLLSVTATPAIGAALSVKPMLYLGAISYSIYLTHHIVIMVFKNRWVDDHLTFGTWPYFFTLAALTVPLCIGVSHLTHRYIETPYIEKGKQLSVKTESPAQAKQAVS